MILGSADLPGLSTPSAQMGLGEMVSRRTAPTTDWTDMSHNDHFVQFYESDDHIVGAVAEYLVHGLRSGDACIVIATREHVAGIEKLVAAYSDRFEIAVNAGQYIALDAQETLDLFMVNGLPDADKFTQGVGTVIQKAAARGGSLRAFGEMVGVLCGQGNFDAAVRLEELWNDLQTRFKFSLFCAYSISVLGSRTATERMSEICSGHSRVIPCESYSSISNTNERLQMIAKLQQKTKQLESELAEMQRRLAAKDAAPEILAAA